MGRYNPIYVGSDNVFRTRGIRNSLTGEFINDAVVELTLLDANGDELSGQSWPLTLSYIASSDGEYQGTIDDAVVAEDGQIVEAVIDISGDGLTAQLRLEAVFSERGAPSLAWTSRSEIEKLFGVTNVSKWADLDNTQDADAIAAQIQWVVDHATDEARVELTDSLYNVQSGAVPPLSLRLATTRLAGVMLYESRGVVDTEDEEGRHRLRYHDKKAKEFFSRVKAGIIRIGPAADRMVPAAVKDSNVESDDLIIDGGFVL